MRKPGTALLVMLALVAAGCGGDDDAADSEATTQPPADLTPPGNAPPGGTSQLPPAFLDCMANEGYEISSPDEIHSAPPEVLQKCFGALHGGG